MTCTIFLTRNKGRFRAHVAELPECDVEAEGHDEVLALIEKRAQEIVNSSEIFAFGNLCSGKITSVQNEGEQAVQIRGAKSGE